MQYQRMQRERFAGQFTNGQFQGRNGAGANGGIRFRNGGNGAAGTILSVDANSMTVKLPDGSSKIVLLTGSTTINKAESATRSDLTAGVRVAAFGATNSDGSITATNVQINPEMRGPGGPSGASGSSGVQGG